MSIITMEAAKRHLRPPGDIDDVRIQDLMEQASMIVLEYIKLPFDAYLDTTGVLHEDDVPPTVRAATLLVLGALYDNADGQDADKMPLSEAVKALLHGRRVPTLA